MKHLFLAAFLLSFLLAVTVPTAYAAPSLAELGEFFASPAGELIAREMGFSVGEGSAISASDAERLGGYLERVRARYLEERPEEEGIFETSELRPKQAELLRELLWDEADREPGFIALSEELHSYRANLRALVQGPSAESVPAHLPERVQVSINKSQSKKLFGLARADFEKSFSPDSLRAVLTALEEGGVQALSPEAKLALKASRKDASILGNAFSVFDDSHEAPEVIRAFARDFGHLNDAIEAGVQDRITSLAHDFARSLDSRRILRALDRFEPASRDSFDRYTRGLARSLKRLAGHETLPVKEFHEMRKSLKEFMNCLGLCERAGTDPARPALKDAYDFLYQLNNDMGLIHDGFVAADLQGALDYDEQEVAVPERFRQGVLEFLARFENVR